MWRWINQYSRYLNQMDEREWFAVLIAVLILGFFCMRGFGSRKYY